MMNEVSMTLSR